MVGRGYSAVEFRFVGERVSADLSDERFVFARDDHNAAFSHRVPSAVLFLVVADGSATRDEHIAIDDGAPNACVPPDADTRHQNAPVDIAVTMHPYVRAEDAAGDPAARHDTARRDDRIERLSAAAAFVGEHELRGRRLHLVRAERPLRIVEVELRVHLAEIHVRVEVGIQGADVAPVLGRLLVLVIEPVGEDREFLHERRNDVLAEIVSAGTARILFERRAEDVDVEDVNTHRREHLCAGRQMLRLLEKTGDAVVLACLQNAEL